MLTAELSIEAEGRQAQIHLLAALHERAQRNPSQAAFTVYEGDREVALTCSALWAEVARWAGRIRQVAAKENGVVFLVLKHRSELYTAFLGAMRAGLTPSFLPAPSAKQDPERYWTSHRAVLERTEPVAVITDSDLVAQMRTALEGLDVPILNVDSPRGPPFEARWTKSPDPMASLDELALLQHSSGTTGLKKGVALTYRQIALQAEAYRKSIELSSNDVIASWLPLYHDMGLMTAFLLPVQTGIHVISIDAFSWVANPIQLLSVMDKHKATLAWLPNFAFAHMTKTRPTDWRGDLSHVKAFIGCSEPNRAETFKSFTTAFAANGVHPGQMQACYAMAETVFAVSQSKLGEPVRVVSLDAAALARGEFVRVDGATPGSVNFVSNGPLLDGLELEIEGLSGASDQAGTIGALRLRGGFLFDGYYRNEEATKAVVSDGWYNTGDVGFLDEGELFICGRLKEIIIVHGRNYYAGDLEALVSKVQGVIPGRAVVFGINSEESGSEEAVAVVETDIDDPKRLQEIRRAVKRVVAEATGLALYTVRCERRGWLIKTTSGKISRGDNLKKFTAVR